MANDSMSRLRILARLNRERAERLDQLASLAMVEPPLPKASAQLSRRRQKLLEALAKINELEREIDPLNLLGATSYTATSPQHGRNNKPLRFVVWSLLRNNPLRMDDLIDRIWDSGYKTKSPTRANFMNCVQQAIGQCKDAGLVSRDSGNYLYHAVDMDPKEAWTKLQCRREGVPA